MGMSESGVEEKEEEEEEGRAMNEVDAGRDRAASVTVKRCRRGYQSAIRLTTFQKTYLEVQMFEAWRLPDTNSKQNKFSAKKESKKSAHETLKLDDDA